MVEVDNKPKICQNTQYRPSHTQLGVAPHRETPTELLDDHRALEPPDPIPNSEVKRRIADGSVGFPHVRVGHRQASIPNPPVAQAPGGFVFVRIEQTIQGEH